jgi:hypothetical protein
MRSTQQCTRVSLWLKLVPYQLGNTALLVSFYKWGWARPGQGETEQGARLGKGNSCLWQCYTFVRRGAASSVVGLEVCGATQRAGCGDI